MRIVGIYRRQLAKLAVPLDVSALKSQGIGIGMKTA